jgi:hypothetical protein
LRTVLANLIVGDAVKAHAATGLVRGPVGWAALTAQRRRVRGSIPCAGAATRPPLLRALVVAELCKLELLPPTAAAMPPSLRRRRADRRRADCGPTVAVAQPTAEPAAEPTVAAAPPLLRGLPRCSLSRAAC